MIVALSNSGESEEILRLLPAVKRIGARIVAITRDDQNPLARAADLVVAIGDVEEACPMGLAPTTSTAALLAVGDALAMAVLENRPFGRDEYALYHPGGKLGRHLMKVHELMRGGEANPLVRADRAAQAGGGGDDPHAGAPRRGHRGGRARASSSGSSPTVTCAGWWSSRRWTSTPRSRR